MTTQNFNFKSEQEVLDAAKEIILERLNLAKGPQHFTDPAHVSDYLVHNFEQQNFEQFGVLFLNSKHKLISNEILFNGGINSAQVYPRVVAQKALENNAAAVIFYHNHPSGDVQPSQADRDLTVRLVKSLQLIDVKVLDHFIVGGTETFSMASHQMI